ncbi:TetR/AcrR family transcriptional regulator [bacterium]|nr:TetR/AcrR family transcriptional regulator [bacterium]
MGLRERQKTGRTQRILDAAVVLFTEKGFDQVKAEEIAEQAEVSVGTLYNYFGSKNEILLTLSALENEQIEALAAAHKADLTATAADTLCSLLNVYFDPKNFMLDKTLWRLGYALSLIHVSSEAARRFRRSDIMLRQQVVDMSETLQRQGLLRMDLDCQTFGAALFNNASMIFFDFTRSENKTYPDTRQEIDDMTRSLVSLAILPKSTS